MYLFFVVLSCLHERYDQNLFYTKAGSTIIATNPFKDVDDLYSFEKIEEYYIAGKVSSVCNLKKIKAFSCVLFKE